jgi:hypothetical protein
LDQNKALTIKDSYHEESVWNHPAFGATWREKDLKYVQSQTFHDLLKENEIQLVTWIEIGALN